MKILIEIRNYLLKVTGAITDVHVQAWRNRRMHAGENPLEVFAKVKDEAFCIQEAGVLNFQADRELYALVTRKHTDRGDFLWRYPLGLCAPKGRPSQRSPRLSRQQPIYVYGNCNHMG
jgi:hypothetical protein